MEGLEGDVGNFGFSSKVNAIINFAGAINTLSWIDPQDEPIVSVHGDADETINLIVPLVLEFQLYLIFVVAMKYTVKLIIQIY